MLLGVSHVEIPVRALARARAFWIEVAGFSPLSAGADYLDLEGHGAIVRLVAREPATGITIHFQTAQVEEDLAALIAGGAHPRRAPEEHDGRWLGEVETEDGHRLVLWRRLRESDRAVAIPLPTSRPWEAAAEALANRLLAAVPESFRDLARQGAVAEAEHLAPDGQQVAVLEVVRATIRSTPRIMRERLRPSLLAEGYDLDAFPTDLLC